MDNENQRKAEHKYQEGQKAAGLVQTRVWVPAECREELQQFAAKLRQQVGKNHKENSHDSQ